MKYDTIIYCSKCGARLITHGNAWVLCMECGHINANELVEGDIGWDEEE